jgi:hypothetical protein
MYAELKQKTCSQCNLEKSLDSFRFRKRSSKKHNYESYCKACEKENYKEYYSQNRAELRLRDFERNCRKFGLTVTQYENMAEAQQNKCAICKGPETCTRDGVVKRLAIDHCHKTNKVRMLLCNACNTAIGLLDEDPKRFASAVEYLTKFKKLG